jgi:cardiolipin-specific phospholipase
MPKIRDPEELEDLKNYLHQIFLRPASGEYALNTILSVGSWARKPLCKRITELKIGMTFLYGDIDWMDPTSTKQLIKDKKIDGTIYIVEKADHNLFLDNPTDLACKIILDLFG